MSEHFGAVWVVPALSAFMDVVMMCARSRKTGDGGRTSSARIWNFG